MSRRLTNHRHRTSQIISPPVEDRDIIMIIAATDIIDLRQGIELRMVSQRMSRSLMRMNDYPIKKARRLPSWKGQKFVFYLSCTLIQQTSVYHLFPSIEYSRIVHLFQSGVVKVLKNRCLSDGWPVTTLGRTYKPSKIKAILGIKYGTLLYPKEIICSRRKLAREKIERKIKDTDTFLVKISDEIVPVLVLLQASKRHLGTWNVLLWVLQVFKESLFLPSNALVYVGSWIRVTGSLTSLAAKYTENKLICVWSKSSQRTHED